MSRLWNSLRDRLNGSCLRVHLAPDALMACEVQLRRDGRRVVRKECFAYTPHLAGARRAAMQALQAWMGESTRLVSQEWVLGTSAVRYLLLPWAPALAERTLRTAMAAALFEKHFKEDPGGYAVRFAKPSYGRDQVVAFVANELLDDLNDHALVSRTRLRRVTPSIAVVWERFRRVLNAQSGALCVIDGNRQIVVRHDHGHISDVALRPFDVERFEHAPLDAAGEQGAESPASEGETSWQVFSSVPMGHTPPQVRLWLAEGGGFLATRDAAYAFALCGVF